MKLKNLITSRVYNTNHSEVRAAMEIKILIVRVTLIYEYNIDESQIY